MIKEDIEVMRKTDIILLKTLLGLIVCFFVVLLIGVNTVEHKAIVKTLSYEQIAKCYTNEKMNNL